MRIDVHLFGVEEMVKAKINWHTTSAKIFQKDVVLQRFHRYLKGIGLYDETVKLYMGRLKAFLDHAKQDEPPIEAANDYRDMLIDSNFSRTHINNTCFAIKKFYQMINIEWNFTFLKPNEQLTAKELWKNCDIKGIRNDQYGRYYSTVHQSCVTARFRSPSPVSVEIYNL